MNIYGHVVPIGRKVYPALKQMLDPKPATAPSTPPTSSRPSLLHTKLLRNRKPRAVTYNVIARDSRLFETLMLLMYYDHGRQAHVLSERDVQRLGDPLEREALQRRLNWR